MVTEFEVRVYSAVSMIPRGKISTYRDVAHALHTRAYRAVGQALRKNPFAPDVPCHRVVSADGRIGGFNGGTSGLTVNRKISMLKEEGIRVDGKKIMDFEKVLYRYHQ